MDILRQIVARKRDRLRDLKSSVPLSELKRRLHDLDSPRGFRDAVTRGNRGIRLIAELKQASPSKGLLRKDFDPVEIASIYERSLVDAVSVLTEEDFFQGKPEYVRMVKAVTSKPVLRKDFIFDEYQLYEARCLHADAILLIAAILERSQAEEFLHLAGELSLGVLFEVHDEDDLDKALFLDADILGINNRDLRTLKVDLQTTLRLKRDIPVGKTVVSESGITDRNDVESLDAAGIDAMLIGTSLMQAPDITRKILDLMAIRS
ncbi:MAG TPA: indole-3-glycerol phosphate synthase TrpC [Dissulfurispiraceae bacterium]|nr:indole-3-glycerol phosphate synthase TrpC [Dissulfurispiraceae bacterium]